MPLSYETASCVHGCRVASTCRVPTNYVGCGCISVSDSDSQLHCRGAVMAQQGAASIVTFTAVSQFLEVQQLNFTQFLPRDAMYCVWDPDSARSLLSPGVRPPVCLSSVSVPQFLEFPSMFWRKVVGLISYGKGSTTVSEVELEGHLVDSIPQTTAERNPIR